MESETAAGDEKTTIIPIDDIASDDGNARRRDKKGEEAIKASLERFGPGRSIVIDGDNTIRAGNGTTAEAKKLGFKRVIVVEPGPDELVAVRRSEWTEEEARGYGVADNKASDLSFFDDSALAALLKSVPSVDPGAMGFEKRELASLLARVNRQTAKQDDVPDPPKVAVTRLGDVWELGRHRVVCGDSRAGAIDGASGVSVAFTSPPYADRRKYDGQAPMPKPEDYVEWFAPVAAAVKSALAPGGSWFVNIKEQCEDGQRCLYVKDLTIAHAREWGWRFVDEYCWTHGGTPKKVINRFKNGWEPVFHFTTGPHRFFPANVMHESRHVPVALGPGSGVDTTASKKQGKVGAVDGNAVAAGMAYPSNHLALGKNRTATSHPAAFPVSLPSFFIESHSEEGDTVCDPFLGSGTTLIAAGQLDRTCYGIEISPAYCDVVVERWENLTSAKAKRIVGKQSA